MKTAKEVLGGIELEFLSVGVEFKGALLGIAKKMDNDEELTEFEESMVYKLSSFGDEI